MRVESTRSPGDSPETLMLDSRVCGQGCQEWGDLRVRELDALAPLFRTTLQSLPFTGVQAVHSSQHCVHSPFTEDLGPWAFFAFHFQAQLC